MIVAASPQLHLLVVRLTSEAKERQSQSTRVRMIVCRTERNALDAAPDIAIVDVGLNFLSKNLTAESH